MVLVRARVAFSQAADTAFSHGQTPARAPVRPLGFTVMQSVPQGIVMVSWARPVPAPGPSAERAS
ncbi:hypothetical protein [Leptolyngbya sp. 7M]|uniref:hypothetical protein n=1 Tax=Leptolyngbya sp. 7M TaxID=2812896 RepID=UPI001B8AD05D|nr:hypothetical protein JVX88_32720 [Leptolyngbya sp. 7M]